MQSQCSEKILNEYAESIAKLIDYSVTNYDCGNDIVLSGGLFSNGTILMDLIAKNLKCKVNFILPTLPQIYGACYKCLCIYGKLGDEFYGNFKANYQNLIN